MVDSCTYARLVSLDFHFSCSLCCRREAININARNDQSINEGRQLGGNIVSKRTDSLTKGSSYFLATVDCYVEIRAQCG